MQINSANKIDNVSELESIIQVEFFDSDNNGKYFPKICGLHAVTSESQEAGHNCIACNFADIVIGIQEVAKTLDIYSNPYNAKITYIMWLYLLSERMQEIFKLISMPDEIKSEKFKTFICVKRWGNFFKHPKAFFLVHHPEFNDVPGNRKIIIDNSFINKYYSGDKNNADLYKKLSNSREVIVKFPDLVDFTRGLAKELQVLKEIIQNNPIYQDVLRSKTVIENYYSNESNNL